MSAPTKLASQGISSFLAIASASISGILSTALIARSLSPDGMGLYTLVLWIAAMAGMLANMGYVTTTLKSMAEALGRQDELEAAGILAFANRRVLVMGALATLALGILGPVFARIGGKADLALPLVVGAIGLLPCALLPLYTATFQALERYDRVALITSLTSVVTIAGVALVTTLHGGIASLLGILAASSTIGTLCYLALLREWRSEWWLVPLPRERIESLKRYQGPVFVMLLLDAVVWQRSEVFFLGAYAPPSQVAFYGMAFALSSMAMKLIPGTLVGLLIPKMSRSVGSGDPDGIARLFRLSCRYMAMLAIPVAVGGALLADPLVRVLYGPNYLEIVPLLQVLLAANALVMIYGFPASSVLYSTNGQDRLVKIGLVVSAFNLLLAMTLIPRYGAWGAVGANCLAQLASLGPGILAAKRHTGSQAPLFVVFKILLAAAMMAVPIGAIVAIAPPWLALGAAPFLGAIAYALAVWKLGVLEPEDLERILAIVNRLRLRDKQKPALDPGR